MNGEGVVPFMRGISLADYKPVKISLSSDFKLNKMRHYISNIISCTLLGLLVLTSSSCSMMTEDLDDCPTGLYVRFVYDYNTMRADMFKDHVGYVQLNVFDENGQFVTQRTVCNSGSDAPIARYGYTMHFSTSEVPAGHSYRLQAVAMQRDWDEALSTEGAKYRRNASSTENYESLTITLDHNNEPIAGTSQHAVSNAAPLDTLWHTLKVTPHAPADGIAVPDIDPTGKPYSIFPAEDQMVRVEEEHATYATVSLIRDTKHLNLTLQQIDNATDVFANDYEVEIIDNNAALAYDNAVLTDDSVRYTPYACWTSRLLEDNTMEIEEVYTGNPGQYHAPTRADDDDTPKVLQRMAHFNIMFNRLMINGEKKEDNALLVIHNKHTGELVAEINLPYMLSLGRMAYEIRNYGQQEYLDREHDYRIDLLLKGDEWVAVEIHVLSWSKRFQSLEF